MTAPSRPMLPSTSIDKYLRGNAIAVAVQQLLLFLVFAGLATSRAESHVLSGAAVAGIVSVAAAGATIIGWTSNLFGGAFQARMGAVAFDEDPPLVDRDPLTARRLWGSAFAWAAAAAAWALAGAGIVAVALNGRVVRFPVMFVALTLLAGVPVVAISQLARRIGVDTHDVVPEATVPLRRRAWLQVALPTALTQGLLNAGVAWLLFHAYPTGNAAVPDVLTDSTALADALLVVVPLTVIFAGITVYWGALDRMTGRVTLNDADTQTVTKRSQIGPQVMVYTAVLGMVAFRVAAYVLPATPSLTQVIVARGVLSAMLVGVATALGYIRGACNEVAE